MIYGSRYRRERVSVAQEGTGSEGTGEEEEHGGEEVSGGGGGGNGGHLLTSDEDMKKVYFDLLIQKAQSSETIDTELLDRIERVAGIEKQ
jgi:hypothetical protein